MLYSMHVTHTPLYLHLVAAPLSIEQVAKSRTPPCKSQFKESSLASDNSEHCSIGPTGEMNNYFITTVKYSETYLLWLSTYARQRKLLVGVQAAPGRVEWLW